MEAALISVAVGMLLLTPLTVKVFTGRDGFVFYRDVICIFATVWLALRWLHQPMLPYPDVTITGAVMFHACGRIGCLLSGCCFGRPAKFGIRYRHAHAAMGFPCSLPACACFPFRPLPLDLTSSVEADVTEEPGAIVASQDTPGAKPVAVTLLGVRTLALRLPLRKS